jgi:hypothetical protein
MIDFRLYRVAWLPAVVAFVVLMFSLEGRPEPIEPELAPAGFDGRRAAITARQLATRTGDRQAGSPGDAGAAELVRERFEQIEAGTTTQQAFEADVDGEDAELRNIALTLPGESDRTILVIAARDTAHAPGAVSSGAATATLVELAEVLGGSDHARTIALVSTDGAAQGGVGAREFLDAYPNRELIDAAARRSSSFAPRRLRSPRRRS